MDSFFYRIYQYFASRKALGFCSLLIAFVGLLFMASEINFEEDITKLIPTNDENTEVQQVLKTVNFADKIIIHISKEPSESVEDLTKYASLFIDSISKSSGTYIKHIQGKIEDKNIQSTLNFVYQNLPLFLDENDYVSIHNKIIKDSIAAITFKNYKTLISPTGIVAKQNILKDPLGLSFIALRKLQELSFGNEFILHNGFLISKNKNHLLLFITPTTKSSDTSENTEFSNNLYQLSSQLNQLFKQKVKSELFGSTLIAVANAKQIKNDIQLTVGIAVSILLIILMLFYRKLSIPIILFVPTIFGGLLAVSMLYFIRSNVSAISLGIGSVLLGVTLDYSLHILTHIRSNSTIKNLYQEITKPILMSSLTTALAFLCLLFLNSQALQDLGIFAAISVFGASCFALVFIPQVYKKSDSKSNGNNIIEKIASISIHKKKWVIITLLIAFGISLFTYNKVVFNNDLAKLNYEPSAIKAAQLSLDELTNSTSKSIYLVAYGDSEQEALKINDQIFNQLQHLKSNNKIINFSSIGTLIHSEIIQKQKIDKWSSFWTDETIQSTKNSLIESGKILGFKSSTFNEFYTLLNSEFKPLQSQDFSALNTILIDDYIATKNGFTTITSLVKVQDDNIQKTIDIFKENANTVVIDRQSMNETLLGHLKTDFNTLIGYSLGIVLIILLLFYKSFSLTIVTSIPICLTWLLTIGIMGVLHIEFNIFNIIISTFIFGLGIDYGIFITNGLLHEYKTGEKVLPKYKTSIILSVITTVLGVGVLIFAKHPALYSISLVSIIGILSAIIISFTIQPLLFNFFIGSKIKSPIRLRFLFHSVLSFLYYGLGGLLLSIFSATVLKLIPISKKTKMYWFHKVVSKFMETVLDSYPFFNKSIINENNETFEKPSIIIANHTSFLDILAIGMLHPKIIFLVNDWVYNSPVFGKAVQAAGFYPVSSGIENGLSHLEEKVRQGYSLMAFPEGTRSTTNKIKRFHKGAFYLAEQFNLDIIPVLIHGNSEILPKGSFIIKEGAITLKILDRIKADDARFGTNYSHRTKQISTYFKHEFETLRNTKEPPNYFHKLVLENYRYKGDSLYKIIKEDLKVYSETYKSILDVVESKANIIHLSKDFGQLDFLLALDGVDRKIIAYNEDSTARTIAENCFISNTNNKISFSLTLEEAMTQQANVLIVNLDANANEFIKLIDDNITVLILLKESRNLIVKKILALGFKESFQNKNILILKK